MRVVKEIYVDGKVTSIKDMADIVFDESSETKEKEDKRTFKK